MDGGTRTAIFLTTIQCSIKRHFRFLTSLPVWRRGAQTRQLSGNSRGPHCACATTFRKLPWTTLRMRDSFPEFPDSFPNTSRNSRQLSDGGLGRGEKWPRGSASYVDEGPWVRGYDVIRWRHFRFGGTQIMTSLPGWPGVVSGEWGKLWRHNVFVQQSFYSAKITQNGTMFICLYGLRYIFPIGDYPAGCFLSARADCDEKNRGFAKGTGSCGILCQCGMQVFGRLLCMSIRMHVHIDCSRLF